MARFMISMPDEMLKKLDDAAPAKNIAAVASFCVKQPGIT